MHCGTNQPLACLTIRDISADCRVLGCYNQRLDGQYQTDKLFHYLKERFEYIVAVGVDKQGYEYPETDIVDFLQPLVRYLFAGDHLQ